MDLSDVRNAKIWIALCWLMNLIATIAMFEYFKKMRAERKYN